MINDDPQRVIRRAVGLVSSWARRAIPPAMAMTGSPHRKLPTSTALCLNTSRLRPCVPRVSGSRKRVVTRNMSCARRSGGRGLLASMRSSCTLTGLSEADVGHRTALLGIGGECSPVTHECRLERAGVKPNSQIHIARQVGKSYRRPPARRAAK